jgi:hypothetical protein
MPFFGSTVERKKVISARNSGIAEYWKIALLGAAGESLSVVLSAVSSIIAVSEKEEALAKVAAP